MKIRLSGMTITCIVLSLICIALLFIPSGFESGRNDDSLRVKVKVVDVDNTLVSTYGVTSHGHQTLLVRAMNSSWKNTEWSTTNLLTGKLELDTLYEPGDTALAVLDMDSAGKEVLYTTVIGPYRLDIQLVLLLVFIVFLTVYAGKTGIKAILSFAVSLLCIWKLFIPAILKGFSPIPFAILLVVVLTAIIIFLVAGFTKKGLTAFIGAISGVGVTAIMALVFGRAFHLHGAIRPFAESLLHSGFAHLDLTSLLYATVFIAASGAVMDLAMDIAAAVDEIHVRHPRLRRLELIKSGMVVGRSVVGTMTTTLLFAYSSSYITLLMVFMAQDIPFANMLNLSYISAEILTTLVGSFGLVTVAPLSALAAGVVYSLGTHTTA